MTFIQFILRHKLLRSIYNFKVIFFDFSDDRRGIFWSILTFNSNSSQKSKYV